MTPGRNTRVAKGVRRAHRASAVACESLENRRLLSTINWINKGFGPGILDTDNFNAIYGVNATLARAIAQRAIDDWERVITNFNGFGGRNSIDLTLSAGVLGPTTSGSTQVTSYDLLFKPADATITMDDNAAGAGWYFDPIVGNAFAQDDSEFNSVVTPWAADDTSQSGRDFYRSTLHELGHAMGLISSSPIILGFEVDVGDDPLSNAASDRLVTLDLNGDSVPDYTLTTTGGRHLYEGGGGYTGPIHPNEILNAGRAVSNTNVRRGLISDSLATCLRDLYGYTITLPSTINTFYVNLNLAANSVTVNGDLDPSGDLADVIDVEVSGSSMRFEVNGTSETIDGSDFGAVIVNAGAGADDIDIDQLLSGKSAIVNGENGDDRIDIAQQFGDIDTDLLANVTANGGAGTDTLSFHDQNDGVGGDTYSITSPAVNKNGRQVDHLLFESVDITGSPQNSTYNIDSFAPFSTLVINAGAGNDTFNVGDDDYDSRIFGDVDLSGGSGTDVLNINDANDTGAGEYNITASSFGKTSGGSMVFDGMQQLTVNGSGQASRYNVEIGSAGLPVTVNCGAGNDTMDIGGASDDIDNAVRSPISLFGQGGNDLLELNDTGDSGADSYTIDDGVFAKDSAQFASLDFAGTERINLVGNAGSNIIDIVNVSSTIKATLNGGDGNDQFINSALNLNTHLQGSITLNGGGGTDTITLSDDNDNTATAYTLTQNTFQVTGGVASGLVNYSNVESFDFTANPFATEIDVDSANATTAYTVAGGDGDDTIVFGGTARDVSNVLGDVEVHGGPGTDRLYYHDDGSTLSGTYIVSTNTLGRSGTGNVDPIGVESVLVDASTGNDTINVNDTFASATTTVNGHEGDDLINVGNGHWDAGIQGPVTVNGGFGIDSIAIDDSADTGADDYVVTATQTTSTGAFAAAINYTTLESYRLDANADANMVTVNSTFAGECRIRGNGGDDTIDVVDNAIGQFVRVDGGAGLDTVRVNSDAAGAARVEFNQTQDLQSLQISDGGTLRVNAGGDKVVSTRNLQILGNGVMDLTDEDLILDYTGVSPLAAVRAGLTSGYAGGLWNGIKINSSTAAANASLSTALGYGEASNVLGPAGGTFSGIAVDNTAVLVKYTYYGDADLNGAVDITDLSRLATNWQLGSRNWTQGNFDYDAAGAVDISDLAKLATNWQAGVGAPLAQSFDSAWASLAGHRRIAGPVRAERIQASILE